MDRAQSVLISSEATHDSDDSICEISHGIFARWPQHLLYAYFFNFQTGDKKTKQKYWEKAPILCKTYAQRLIKTIIDYSVIHC